MSDCTLTLAKFSNILYETPFYTVVYFWIACQTIKVFIFPPGQYNTALDKVVQNFMQKMSQLQHSRKRNLLDGFASAFQGTVEQLKQVRDICMV